MLKRSLFGVVLIAVFGLMVYGCSDNKNPIDTKDSVQNGKVSLAKLSDACGTPTVVTLFAGQTIDVGTVTVDNNATNLCVTYETTGDWYILETHLHIARTLEGIPQTKTGNPKVGNFAYQSSHLLQDHVQSKEYCFNIEQLKADIGLLPDEECMVIAAHASVARDSDGDGNPEQQETAWGDGPPFTDKGSWAMYFQYCIQPCDEPPPPPSNCETAFAFGGDVATCFIGADFNGDGQDDGFNRWGWSNGPLGRGSYTFDIYAGAGQCDLSKGTLVGTLTVNYDGSTATVTYTMNSPYVMDETHLYVGSEPLARDVNGNFTVAPGQYPNIKDLNNATTDSYTVSGLSGNIYVVAHATVCGF